MRESEKVIEVPISALLMLCDLARDACSMHAGFIQLFRQETELKKHHKAYLKLRDQMERMCDRDMENLIHIKQLVQSVEKIIELQAASDEGTERNSDKSADITLSLDDLEILADDISTMYEVVDQLSKVFGEMMRGYGIRGTDLRKILEDAEDAAEDAVSFLKDLGLDGLMA